ncbi:MAG TPA: D-alanine--D-alanine ligase [Gemmataceae bacterium]|nr:D-alanine--D-alanine ligase [Gemmataceae bacterium]
MRIGITYDLKTDGPIPAGLPDDFQEEFDSPATIEAIAEVLRGLGHTVEKLGDGRPLLERLLADPPDFVFNFAEGQGIGRSREARVPAVLEMLGIPYTGSDPLTLAVTLDKDCAKRLVASAGIAVPAGVVIGAEEWQMANWKNHALEQGARPPASSSSMDHLPFAVCHLQFPLIAKPAWEGSSKGIRSKCLIDRPEDLPEVVASLRRDHRQPILLEEFIPGDEITVGILGNRPPQVIGVMRVVPRSPNGRFVYSLEVKRDWRRQVRYECPPSSCSPDTLARIESAALEVYQRLGCRDVARIDFRLADEGLYFLEANPLPGLNPESSDLVIMARLAGWSYPRLIGSILAAALERTTSDFRSRNDPCAF